MASGVGTMPLISTGSTVYETSYILVQEALESVLRTVVVSRAGAVDERSSVCWRACAALYSLVVGHPVDRRGRCRSCRRPGAVLGRTRRRCQVRVAACYWLHQPHESLLLEVLAHELPQRHSPSAVAGKQTERPALDHRETLSGRQPRLTGSDLLERIALRRIDQGGVTMLGAHYLDHGRTVPCFLPETFHWLAEAHLIRMLDPDHSDGLRRIVITPRGRIRYRKLESRIPSS